MSAKCQKIQFWHGTPIILENFSTDALSCLGGKAKLGIIQNNSFTHFEIKTSSFEDNVELSILFKRISPFLMNLYQISFCTHSFIQPGKKQKNKKQTKIPEIAGNTLEHCCSQDHSKTLPNIKVFKWYWKNEVWLLHCTLNITPHISKGILQILLTFKYVSLLRIFSVKGLTETFPIQF